MNLQETAWFALKEQRKYGTEEFEEVWVIHGKYYFHLNSYITLRAWY